MTLKENQTINFFIATKNYLCREILLKIKIIDEFWTSKNSYKLINFNNNNNSNTLPIIYPPQLQQFKQQQQ